MKNRRKGTAYMYKTQAIVFPPHDEVSTAVLCHYPGVFLPLDIILNQPKLNVSPWCKRW